jgi:formyltetrahydrofolate synthetase
MPRLFPWKMNLHFTEDFHAIDFHAIDFHAIGTVNHLLAAMVDNHIHQIRY